MCVRAYMCNRNIRMQSIKFSYKKYEKSKKSGEQIHVPLSCLFSFGATIVQSNIWKSKKKKTRQFYLLIFFTTWFSCVRSLATAQFRENIFNLKMISFYYSSCLMALFVVAKSLGFIPNWWLKCSAFILAILCTA